VCEGTDWSQGPFLGQKKNGDVKHCADAECGAGTAKQDRKDCKYCGSKNFIAGPNPDPPAFMKTKNKSKDVKVLDVYFLCLLGVFLVVCLYFRSFKSIARSAERAC